MRDSNVVFIINDDSLEEAIEELDTERFDGSGTA